jgi:rfaE bifunctional protein nucleotidyltransferase chain/domain
MNTILTTDHAIELGNTLSQEKKKIVLAGGCFDILHIGHISFLEKARSFGDVLCVLLEADETITATKGANRPINNQQDRAKMLASLKMVDYVILLPPGMTNDAYDTLVFAIKPAIIATTKGEADSYRKHKERQAAAIGAEVVEVVDFIQNQSTTKIVKILQEL